VNVPSLFLLFNHRITQKQEEAAYHALHVDRIVAPPSDLKKIWRQVPPELPEIHEYLAPIRRWLKEKAHSGDYVLIQGDFGATYLMVLFALQEALIPLYSTTNRNAIEENKEDGSIELRHNFYHRIFRRYGV
jgi:hypothetical protein